MIKTYDFTYICLYLTPIFCPLGEQFHIAASCNNSDFGISRVDSSPVLLSSLARDTQEKGGKDDREQVSVDRALVYKAIIHTLIPHIT